MYNDYEEKEYNSKLSLKVWKKIFKEMWKYPVYCIGAVLSMIGAAFTETMFIKYICADGLERFLNTGINNDFWIFIVEMFMFVMCLGICTLLFLRFAGLLELKFYKGLTKDTFAKLQNQPFSSFRGEFLCKTKSFSQPCPKNRIFSIITLLS